MGVIRISDSVDSLEYVADVLEDDARKILIGVPVNSPNLSTVISKMGKRFCTEYDNRFWYKGRRISLELPARTLYSQNDAKRLILCSEDSQNELQQDYMKFVHAKPNLRQFTNVDWHFDALPHIAQPDEIFCNQQTTIMVPSDVGPAGSTDKLLVSGTNKIVLELIYEYWKRSRWRDHFRMKGLAHVQRPRHRLCRLIFAPCTKLATFNKCEQIAWSKEEDDTYERDDYHQSGKPTHEKIIPARELKCDEIAHAEVLENGSVKVKPEHVFPDISKHVYKWRVFCACEAYQLTDRGKIWESSSGKVNGYSVQV